MVNQSKIVEGKFPGQAIRYPVVDDGKWVPLKETTYLENLLKSDLPFDDGVGGQK